MMIADVIRHADSEREIYSLLIAYLEAMQFGNKATFVSQSTTTLPLTGKADLQKRFDQLFLDLDNASKALDDPACQAMKEALHIFGSALQQLRQIESLEGVKNHSSFANFRDKQVADHRQAMRTQLDRAHSRPERPANHENPPISH